MNEIKMKLRRMCSGVNQVCVLHVCVCACVSACLVLTTRLWAVLGSVSGEFPCLLLCWFTTFVFARAHVCSILVSHLGLLVEVLQPTLGSRRSNVF